MVHEIRDEYDVVIMGGGPAGATLGAVLARRTNLRIALFDKEIFPREHIGESFAHPVVPALEASGALAKVLASECWVQKFGGIYSWDETSPKVTYFDHPSVVEDGVYRWALHVNRSEFDHILLDNAADHGVEVFQGVAVKGFESGPSGCAVRLADGRSVRAAYFVDAAGRRTSIAAKAKRQWLSEYRNIAIWQHFTGGLPAQDLPGEWNVFHDDSLSPILCSAFKDGWCWYIPVPKMVGGRRTMTHSIGIVTLPEVLREPGKDFTDPETFMRAVRSVPHVRDLIGGVEPIAEGVHTATNYSMINDRFTDFDERWILAGDAAFFVDPLFSSGVAFGMTMGAATALLLEQTFSSALSEQDKRDLWQDYDEGWHGLAETFALSIDQWYHAIGKNDPESVYWRSRGAVADLDIQDRTFDALLNTALIPDLLQVLSGGTGRIEDLDRDGPYMRAAGLAEPAEVDDGTPLRLVGGVTARRGPGVDVPGFKAFMPPAPYQVPPEVKAAFAQYWKDPLSDGGALPAPLDAPLACHRFQVEGRPAVRGLDRDGAEGVWAALRAGPVTLGSFGGPLGFPQRQLVKRLLRAGLVTPLPAGSGGARP
ncbi:MAG TPA: NAD(P)/FAD-dependent oxidoreductase [Actinophytocola sp.]|jgi:2-polyprenyl-6-methoxyphenol hydroxylase-like FAD-dependent oxidoreductase|uniref:NAD(P)/FAD-dependent oxidoreductase n=1 Tax=Actinophytocola sp. TaxID=1872138 RepID=UPI002E02F846|nr:NAD(P)/FAD-dependent oxidoreductase [Actinophytocola sp.]